MRSAEPARIDQVLDIHNTLYRKTTTWTTRDGDWPRNARKNIRRGQEVTLEDIEHTVLPNSGKDEVLAEIPHSDPNSLKPSGCENPHEPFKIYSHRLGIGMTTLQQHVIVQLKCHEGAKTYTTF